jgi:hypothetical protein
VTLSNPDGSYSGQWIVASGLFTSQAMFLDEDDHTYLKILQEEPKQGQNWTAAGGAANPPGWISPRR